MKNLLRIFGSGFDREISNASNALVCGWARVLRHVGFAVLLCLLPGLLRAQTPPNYNQLDWWGFDNSNFASVYGYAPVAFTNVSSVPAGGDGNSLLIDSTNPAWLTYPLQEPDGTTNLILTNGTIIVWLEPTNWSSANAGGTGPGDWARLIEVGAYSTNATGWWSLYLDPGATNLYFSAQTNGAGATYLTAPVSFTNGGWYCIGLTYSATNTALYVNAVLVTNGTGVTYWPGPNATSNGVFYVGSDSAGENQAMGCIDDLSTYDQPLDASTVASLSSFFSIMYEPVPFTNSYVDIVSAPPSPTPAPVLEAITGQGFLIPVGTAGNCVSSSVVWLTNVVATPAGGGNMNLSFTIEGGSNGVPYDVFANSVLGESDGTWVPWAWEGQGYQCTTYLLTNLPDSAFVILGTPLDSNFDGITDAFQQLVLGSGNNSGDGLSALYKYLHALPINIPAAIPSLAALSVSTCAVP